MSRDRSPLYSIEIDVILKDVINSFDTTLLILLSEIICWNMIVVLIVMK